MNRSRENKIRSIEKSFGFTVRYKNTATYVRNMAEEILMLRDLKKKNQDELVTANERIRDLELEIGNLDRRING